MKFDYDYFAWDNETDSGIINFTKDAEYYGIHNPLYPHEYTVIEDAEKDNCCVDICVEIWYFGEYSPVGSFDLKNLILSLFKEPSSVWRLRIRVLPQFGAHHDLHRLHPHHAIDVLSVLRAP